MNSVGGAGRQRLVIILVALVWTEKTTKASKSCSKCSGLEMICQPRENSLISELSFQIFPLTDSGKGIDIEEKIKRSAGAMKAQLGGDI